MLIWGIIFLTVLVGMVLPIQAGINAQLAKFLAHPLQAAIISFIVGFMVTAIAAAFTGEILPGLSKLTRIPPYLFIGGFLGACMVMTAILFAPKLGATVLVASLIAGQLLSSVILDNYGWVGFNAHPISIGRIVGIVLLFAGVILVKVF